MKRAKKIIISVIAVILAAVIAFGSYLGYRLYVNKPKTQNAYQEIYLQKAVSLDVDEHGMFRIIKINDTHFFNGTCEEDVKTLEDLKKILDNTPCDLIVVDGDLAEGFNLSTSYDKYQAIRIFAELIEEYNVPWTFAPGNNDGEIDGENEDVIAFMMQYDHFLCGNEMIIDGAMQFFIDLKQGGETVHTVAILDSLARKPKVTGSYDYMKESQIHWLINGINSRQVKTSVFFHMPTPAFQQAYDNGEAYSDFAMYNTYPYNGIENNELFDDLTADNEYISLISCAHQHSNNMCSFYNGKYYQLSSVSGYSAGYDDFIEPSVTLTEINVNAENVKDMYSFEQIKAQQY